MRCGQIPVVPNWFIKVSLVCKTICGYVQLKDFFEYVEKRRGLSPRVLGPIVPPCTRTDRPPATRTGRPPATRTGRPPVY